MGKMFRIYDTAERNPYVASVYLYIYVLSGRWNAGKNLIDQIGNLFFTIRFYKIMQGTDLEALYCVVCGCGGKDQKTVRIRFP